ncbi:MAG: membrane protein insertase YidC, partial [bacterium]
MDRRTLLFFAISAAILLLYQEFVLNPMLPPPSVEVAAPASTTPAPGTATAAPVTAPAEADLAVLDEEPLGALPVATTQLKGQTILLETDLYQAKISTLGGRVESFQLKNFRETSDDDSPLLDLIVPAPEDDLPLGIELRGARVWTDAGSIYEASHKSLRVSGSDSATLVLRTSLGGKSLEKRFTIQGDAYPIGLKTRIPDAAGLPASLSQDGPDGSLPAVALVLTRGAKPIEEGTIYEGTAALVDDKLEETARDDLEEPETLRGTIGWAGFEDHYFLTAAAPDRASAVQMRRRGAKSLQTRIITPRNASGPTDIDYTLYFGPKERSTLDAAGHGYSKALNLGWFGPISLLLLDLLQFLHRFSSNWGVDIILLTIVVKGAFWPLTKK